MLILFNLIQILIFYKIFQVKKFFIKNKDWKINKAFISSDTRNTELVESVILKTNLNYKDINSLFSNLNSLSVFELSELKNKYDEINLSSIEVNSALQKIISFPFYLMLMTVLASTIMMNIKQNKSKIFHLIFGILVSVIIYYLSFFEELGKNEQIPVIVSIWIPLIMITIISLIFLIRINEK